MNISPIRTDADLMAALAEVDQLIETDPQIGTPAGNKLDFLASMIEAYEAENYPIDKPDPDAAI